MLIAMIGRRTYLLQMRGRQLIAGLAELLLRA